MEIVKIQTAALLAGSETLNVSNKDASEWGARNFDFDDDEE